MSNTSQAMRATAAVFLDGRREGSAVLVDRRYLLTADHVLKTADHAEVVFPAVARPGGEQARAQARRVPPRTGASPGDAAVLDLGEQPPNWLPEPLTLSPTRRVPIRVSVFGFPRSDHLAGVWRQFETSGPTAVGTVQLDWVRPVGTLPGHSGGPVLDPHTDMVMGVLVAGSTTGMFDRFTPTALIADCWPQLPRPWLLSGPEAVGHFHLRAYGQRSQVRGGDLFRGRQAALATVRTRLTVPDAPGRPLVVTGQPGAGKSAVVARAAFDLQADKVGPGVAFHARGATHPELLTAVADLTGADRANSTHELINALKGRRSELWMVVVDALDEASTTTDRREITRLLAELAGLPTMRVVVATRALTPGPDKSRYYHGGLLPDLGVTSPESPNLVDLDTDRFFEPAGVRDYAAALLAQSGTDTPSPTAASYRADTALCDRLASAVALRADRNYLVAAMAADRLSAEPQVVDPADPGFDPATIPTSVREALDKYLDGLESRHRVRVRGLLTALAYARGTGIDDQLWLDFASALRYTASTEDIDELRDSPAADYLLQATPTDNGAPVTRLFHQALVDELLQRRHRPSDEQALLDVLVPPPDASWAHAGAYACHHAAEHAAACGQLPALLHDPQYLTVADFTRLLPLLPPYPDSSLAPTAAVLRQAAAAVDPLPPLRRARTLSLVAAHHGLAELSHRLAAACSNGIVPRWAHTLGSPHQVLAGHTDWVRAVAVGLAGDRDIIATGSDDGRVRIWDAVTGQPIGAPLISGHGPVESVAIGRAGVHDIIVSGSAFGIVDSWDAVTGQPIGDPIASDLKIKSVAIGRAGDRDIIATGTGHGRVEIWDAVTRRCIVNPISDHIGPAGSVAIARAGTRDIIVTGSDDGTVAIWNAVTGQHVNNLASFHLPVHAVAIGRAGNRNIIAATCFAMARVWDADTGQPIGDPLLGHAGEVRALAIGRAGDRDIIVTGSDDQTVQVRDATTYEPIGNPLIGHDGSILAMTIGRAGTRDIIATASDDQTARIWEPLLGRLVGNPLVGHGSKVNAIAVGRAGDRDVIATGSDDRTVRIWDATTGERIGNPLTEDIGTVWAVAIGRAGNRDIIAAGGESGMLGIWDAVTRTQPIGNPLMNRRAVREAAARRALWTATVHAVAIGRAGDRDIVATSNGEGGVAVWDAATGRLMGNPLTSHVGTVWAVAIGRAGDRDIIAAGGEYGMLEIWDAVTLQPIGTPLTGHMLDVKAVAVGRAGDRDIIATGSDDHTVQIWDAVSRQPIGNPLTGHTDDVRAVAVGRAGDRDIIATGSLDRTVRIWDAAESSVDVVDHLMPVSSVALSSDGTLYVATGSAICAYKPPKQTPRSGLSAT
ncbi:trypsin-like peptidase domain-containing protein [Streptomyces sanyensis]|uniref:trypsin-like peptidase domain-containing protein n=1 Tax=Streptomyces sanyensis TaxID=568869 RepID=UPI003D76D5CD